MDLGACSDQARHVETKAATTFCVHNHRRRRPVRRGHAPADTGLWDAPFFHSRALNCCQNVAQKDLTSAMLQASLRSPRTERSPASTLCNPVAPQVLYKQAAKLTLTQRPQRLCAGCLRKPSHACKRTVRYRKGSMQLARRHKEYE